MFLLMKSNSVAFAVHCMCVLARVLACVCLSVYACIQVRRRARLGSNFGRAPVFIPFMVPTTILFIFVTYNNNFNNGLRLTY